MNVVEGSHHTFHPDGWQQIEEIGNASVDTAESDASKFDYGASFDKEIAEAKAKAKEILDKGEDSSFAQATAQYLTELQASYRHLQSESPHLSPDLVVTIGEARACRELCSIVSSYDHHTPIELKAIDLALTNMKWDALPIEEADALIDSLTGTYKSQEDAIAKDEMPWKEYSNSPLHTIIESIPAPEVQKLFLHTEEDGSLSALARYFDADPGSSNQLVHKARLLLSATESERNLTDMQHHPVIGRLVEKLGGPEAAAIIDGEHEIKMLPLDERFDQFPYTPEDIDKHNDTYDKGIQEYLLTSLGLSRDLITPISTAMKSRLKRTVSGGSEESDTTEPDTAPQSSDTIYERARVVKAMLRIGENVRVLGAGTIERLHNELGVTNIDRYNPEDLQTMVKLLDKDPATIEHMQQGDVMTVMSDTNGDWNGAFDTSLDNVRRETGRSIMFEVAKPSDFYRHMIFLKQRGIKPSSLSIDAHGLPGLTQFGSGTIGDGFFLVAGPHEPYPDPDAEKKNLNVSLFEANIGRFFSDEFFQPSRGIDDAADWIGSTQVIVNSCSSDVTNDKWLYSTAETLATKAAKYRHEDKFNFIGASDVLYVTNSPEGLRFHNKAKKGIGVKVSADIIPPTKKERILAALKGQEAPDTLNITRTSYAVIPVSNSLRKVA